MRKYISVSLLHCAIFYDYENSIGAFIKMHIVHIIMNCLKLPEMHYIPRWVYFPDVRCALITDYSLY